MPLWKRSTLFLFCLGVPAIAASSSQGIQNFHQVDDHVYRGAQPDEKGFEYLASLGVKTVIDLRSSEERSDREERAVTAAGMKYIHIPMTGLTPPTDSELAKILGILEDSTAGPVFVHCKRGADRTGAVIAAYRIDHDGWDNRKALSEAMSLEMSPHQHPRQNFIQTFRPRTIQSSSIPANGDPSPAVAIQ